jgi:hypothetical protein
LTCGFSVGRPVGEVQGGGSGAVVAVLVAPPLDLLTDGTGCGEDEFGGGRRGPPLRFGQDAGVGVGGQDDAGVAELVLDGLEVGASLVGEGCGAVA